LTLTIKSWEIFCIVSTTLVIGLSGPWLVLSKTFRSFHPKLFMGIIQYRSQSMAPAMTILMPISVLSVVPLLIDSHGVNATAFRLDVAALTGSILSAIVAVAFEIPIVNEIVTWTPSAIPANWENRRDRWIALHTIRNAAGLVSLLSLVLAAIIL
jgi:hypothetical protein